MVAKEKEKKNCEKERIKDHTEPECAIKNKKGEIKRKLASK